MRADTAELSFSNEQALSCCDNLGSDRRFLIRRAAESARPRGLFPSSDDIEVVSTVKRPPFSEGIPYLGCKPKLLSQSLESCLNAHGIVAGEYPHRSQERVMFGHSYLKPV